ncbi:DUF4783 domain-containing protein [Mucilaginibacter calamicampi]|uniref:DUF4783 domain-containing protein n=1 Tax=Mucilaginibacter calamicampi TaxID=1302352 RepID=A0ABW2YTM5_9SPHI
MKLLYLPLIAFLLISPSPSDAVDTVAQLIGKGAVHELAKLFPAEVEIEMPAAEPDTYSKAAATAMLEKFFAQNKPVGSKLLHKINNGSAYNFGVVILSTAKGPYRVAFNLKNENNTMQLIKLRIEAEKVK